MPRNTDSIIKDNNNNNKLSDARSLSLSLIHHKDGQQQVETVSFKTTPSTMKTMYVFSLMIHNIWDDDLLMSCMIIKLMMSFEKKERLFSFHQSIIHSNKPNKQIQYTLIIVKVKICFLLPIIDMIGRMNVKWKEKKKFYHPTQWKWFDTHTHMTKWQAVESSFSIVMVKTMEKNRQSLRAPHDIYRLNIYWFINLKIASILSFFIQANPHLLIITAIYYFLFENGMWINSIGKGKKINLFYYLSIEKNQAPFRWLVSGFFFSLKFK